jgi:hypothetical protein
MNWCSEAVSIGEQRPEKSPEARNMMQLNAILMVL